MINKKEGVKGKSCEELCLKALKENESNELFDLWFNPVQTLFIFRSKVQLDEKKIQFESVPKFNF